MERPKPTAGMRHVALFVEKLEEVLSFYTDLLGMEIEWQPVLQEVTLEVMREYTK